MKEMAFEEDGFAKLKIKGDDGTIVEKEVDLYELNNQICEAQARLEGRPDNEMNDAVATIIEAAGFPRPSQRLAIAVQSGVVAEVRRLLGNAGPAQPVSDLPG